MAERIPEAFLDLFRKPILAHLATLMPDGSPQVTPVWIDYDGEHILVNTWPDRAKGRNMLTRPQVALDIVDPDDPFRYLAVRGRGGHGVTSKLNIIPLSWCSAMWQ